MHSDQEHLERRCRLTRTSCKPDVIGREAQGRPLGLLIAWLLDDIEVTREEHVYAFYVLGRTLPTFIAKGFVQRSLPTPCSQDSFWAGDCLDPTPALVGQDFDR